MSQKNTGFISEIDQFIQTFDKQHPRLSETQKKEQAKFKRIYRLRDVTDRPAETKSSDNWFDNNE